MNLAAQNLFGLSERKALGRGLSDLADSADELVELCERALNSFSSVGSHELAARIGGRNMTLDCRASPLEDGGGLVLEIVDRARDLSVRREAELLAQQRVSRRIFRQLAHEVKNPLGGMRGAAQLLGRKLPTADLKRHTDIIIDEADRLARLVDSVLHARGVRKLEELNVHRVTEHVAQLLQAEAPTGVKLVRDYDPSLPAVHVDRNQLIQAVLNIGRNAMQALGERGQIVLRTRASPNFTIGGVQHRLVVTIEIEDNGPGIPADLQEEVFFPLISGNNTGAGIGLTIAQDLVSGNGGIVEFESQPTKTIFRLRLPVIPQPAVSPRCQN